MLQWSLDVDEIVLEGKSKSKQFAPVIPRCTRLIMRKNENEFITIDLGKTYGFNTYISQDASLAKIQKMTIECIASTKNGIINATVPAELLANVELHVQFKVDSHQRTAFDQFCQVLRENNLIK